MPAFLLPLLGAGAVGGLFGFGAGGGLSGVSNLVKWSVIGGLLWIAWKKLK